MSLLAHRGPGRRRSSSGVFHQVSSAVRSLMGGREDGGGSRRGKSSGGLAVVGAAIFCLGIGYAIGNVLPWQRDDANQGGLKASMSADRNGNGRNGIAPGPIGEQEDMRPRSRTFFLTASYGELAAASAAARSLRSAGLLNARLREFQLKDSSVSYGLVVYFDGDADRKSALEALQAVPAPDSTFDSFRKQTQGWPLVRELR